MQRAFVTRAAGFYREQPLRSPGQLEFIEAAKQNPRFRILTGVDWLAANEWVLKAALNIGADVNGIAQLYRICLELGIPPL